VVIALRAMSRAMHSARGAMGSMTWRLMRTWRRRRLVARDVASPAPLLDWPVRFDPTWEPVWLEGDVPAFPSMQAGWLCACEPIVMLGSGRLDLGDGHTNGPIEGPVPIGTLAA
jgi:hypothetical protein